MIGIGNPAERVQHVGRHVIAGHGPQALARRVGEIGADHVGAERQGDLPRHAAHRLGGVERRAQRPAHRQQRLRLAQTQLLALQQVGPLRLRALAIGDVAEDGQVTAGHEPRRRAVLDVPDLTVGADHPQLACLLARLEKCPPAAVEIHPGLEEVVEPAAEQLLDRQAEQPAGGGIGVDERARIVDDEHGVTGGREERFGLWLLDTNLELPPTPSAVKAT